MLNILPVHNELQNVGSNATHNSLYNQYQLADKAFQELANVGSSLSHTNLQLPGYEYILNFPLREEMTDTAAVADALAVALKTYLSDTAAVADALAVKQVIPNSEPVAIADSLTIILKVYIDEVLAIDDILSNGLTNFIDTVAIADQLQLVIKDFMSDTVAVQDLMSVIEKGSSTDGSAVADSLVIKSRIPNSEPTPVGDHIRIILRFNDNSSLQANVNVAFNNNSTQQTNIDQYMNDSSSQRITITPDIDIPVTDITDPNNPFYPSIYINGSTIVANACTQPSNPSELANASVFANISQQGYLLTGVIQAGYCDIASYNVNLEPGGGTWSFTTVDAVAASGDEVVAFGLGGIATGSGRIISNSMNGYITAGVFGAPDLEKQLQLTANYNSFGFRLPDQFLQTPPLAQFSTLATAAKAVAEVCGISLTWSAPDAPLTDLFPQSGMTAKGAIQSLAGRVGAWFVWTGGTTYAVIAPDVGTGGWSLPACELTLSNQSKTLFYITDPVIMFPVQPVGQGNITSPPALNPDDISNINKVQKFASVTKKLTSNDPVRYFDVPGSAKHIWIQILTKSETSGQFVTNDPNEWFFYADPTVPSGGAISTRSYKVKQAQVDSNAFPTGNSDIDAGQFSMNLGYSVDVDALTDAYNNAVDDSTTTGSHLVNQSQESFRYVKAGEGSASCIFTGSLPLPGMIFGSPAGGLPGNAIIESVSLSSPGILNISYGCYLRLNFAQPRNFYSVGTAGGPYAG